MLLVAGYTGNLSLRNSARKLLKAKCHFGPLDTGTSASFIIHGAQRTSAMSHLPTAKIGFTVSCSHKDSPDKYNGTGCPVHLLNENKFVEASSAARFSSCKIDLCRPEHRGS